MKILSWSEIKENNQVDWEVKIELPNLQTIILRIPQDISEYDEKYPIYLNLVFSGHYR